MPKVKKPVPISLEILDVISLHEKYGIPIYQDHISSDKNISSEYNDEATTVLVNIQPNKACTPTLSIPHEHEQRIKYNTESKEKIDCFRNMIDYETKKSVQDLEYCCFWCRHLIGGFKIGCPINYKPAQVIKEHSSKITGDTFIIQEDIQMSRISEFLNCNSTKEWNGGNYYISYGVFCSVHCCQAWINDAKYDKRWANKTSNMTSYLIDYYNSFVSKKNKVSRIKPAPHWKSLKNYGGNLTISEFREGFIAMEEIKRAQSIFTPKFVPITDIIEHRHLLASSTGNKHNIPLSKI